MEPALLKVVGQVAGIAGISLGVLLLVFRDVVQKKIFATLTKQQSYRLLILVVVLVWSVAVAGVGASVWVRINNPESPTGLIPEPDTQTPDPTTSSEGPPDPEDPPVHTPELQQELENLASILQTLTEKSTSRGSIVTRIRKYCDSLDQSNWQEVLVYHNRIVQENKELNDAKAKPLHFLTVADNDLHGKLVDVLDKKGQLEREVERLKTFPHEEDQLATLKQVAARYEGLAPRLKEVATELIQFVRERQ